MANCALTIRRLHFVKFFYEKLPSLTPRLTPDKRTKTKTVYMYVFFMMKVYLKLCQTFRQTFCALLCNSITIHTIVPQIYLTISYITIKRIPHE